MTDTVVIGVGNRYRRDDGVGPEVAAAVEALRLPGVRVLRCGTETTAILDAWAGAWLAVVVDAAAGGTPGRVRQCALDDLAEQRPVSSHELSLRQTYELGPGPGPGSRLGGGGHRRRCRHRPWCGHESGGGRSLPEAVRAVERAVGEQAQKTRHEQP